MASKGKAGFMSWLGIDLNSANGKRLLSESQLSGYLGDALFEAFESNEGLKELACKRYGSSFIEQVLSGSRELDETVVRICTFLYDNGFALKFKISKVGVDKGEKIE